jgi:hypothetical protein
MQLLFLMYLYIVHVNYLKIYSRKAFKYNNKHWVGHINRSLDDVEMA